MNNRKLIKGLKSAWQVRCKFWTTCGADNCDHHSPHHVRNEACAFFSPVKYCPKAKGFVHDVPYTEGAYADDECDPNLAFKAKRDAENRYSSLGGSDSNVEL